MNSITPGKYFRIPQKGWLGGVCAGFAYFIGVKVWLIRAMWVGMFFFLGLAIIPSLLLCIFPYVLFWFGTPRADEVPSDYITRTRG